MAKPKKGKGYAISGHKRRSASNAKRWMNCAGSIALCESLPIHEQVSADSIHSRRGTCAHAVGEMCLAAYQKDPNTPVTPDDYMGMEVEGVLVDQDIVNGAQVYVEHGRGLIDDADLVEIEESLSLAAFIENMQSDTGEFLGVCGHEHGGTGDLVTGKVFSWLRVTDYKNGKGIQVEVEDNPQLMIYALGALHKYMAEYDFDEIILEIVQPNGFHKDGPIRSAVMSPEELLQWAEDVLLPAAERSVEAEKALKRGDPDFVEKYLKADDDWCTFCPARPRCQAALNDATDNAVIEFIDVMCDDDFGDGSGFALDLALPNPALVTAEHEALILQHGDAIIGFVKAVQQRAHNRAEAGEPIPGHKLVLRTTHRKFVSPEAKIKDDLKRMGLHPHDYMDNPALKSISQLEKVLRAKGVPKERIEEFNKAHVIKPEAGTELVRIDNPRSEVMPAIDAEFSHLYDGDDDMLSL